MADRYDFTHGGAEGVYIPWREMKATYHGKEKSDAKPLKTKGVRRLSIMNRRYVPL
jgi:hypothetical protein